jgi:hypothetical protein
MSLAFGRAIWEYVIFSVVSVNIVFTIRLVENTKE